MDRPEARPGGGGGAEQCSPRFMRLTVNAAPSSTQVLLKSGLPFGAVLQPLAPPRLPGETAVPVVAFGNGGVVRCRRCRTYINPFVAWLDGGRRWKCNLCYLANEVPQEYYSPLDEYTGKRRDVSERPELSVGTVEFVASADYMVRGRVARCAALCSVASRPRRCAAAPLPAAALGRSLRLLARH